MSDEKRINIGINSDGYMSELRKMSESSRAVFAELVSDAKKYSNSRKEIIKYLEDEIKAVERINEANKRSGIVEIRQRRAAGLISKSTEEKELRSERFSAGQDKLFAILLSQLLEEFKSASKKQILEDRVNSEKQIDAIKKERSEREDVSDNKPPKTEEDIKREEDEKKRKDSANKGVAYVGTIAGSGSIYEATARAGQVGAGQVGRSSSTTWALLGGLGVIAAMAGGRAIQASLPYEQALGNVSSLSGASLSTYEGYGRSYSQYGYTMDEVLNRRVELMRARGRAYGNKGESTLDALLLQRGLGVDASTINTIESLQRAEQTGLSTRQITQGTISNLRGVGAIRGNDMSALNEYLMVTAQIGQEQLKTLGRVDSGINTKLVAGIAGMNESFRNPQYLSAAVTSLRAGLTSAPNEQTEALQFSILSRMSPGASFFELSKMRERGNYLPEYLKGLKDISGGGDSYKFAIMSQFGVSAQMAEDIAGGNITALKKRISSKFETGEAVDLESRASMATGNLSSNMAAWTNSFQQTGKDIVDALNRFYDFLGEFKSEGNKQLKRVAEINEKAAQELGKNVGKLEEALYRASLSQNFYRR